jgi:trehalose 6-phosphate phosphatase
MNDLFSQPGIARLDAIVKPGMLCVFDFDGTLAPIVSTPEHASLPSDVREKLVALSSLVPVAILTGRSLADIKARLGFKPDYIAGNHGLEGLPGWEERSVEYERTCRAWMALLTSALQDPQFDSGIRIENKQYSLSVHYRMAQDQLKTEKALAELFAGKLPEARVIGGKCVFNLMPQHAADKGHAMERLMQLSGARSAIYVGDDVTDEDVFRLRRRDLLTIRIEPAAASAAEFYLSYWHNILQFLDDLIRRLHAQHIHDATVRPAHNA